MTPPLFSSKPRSLDEFYAAKEAYELGHLEGSKWRKKDGIKKPRFPIDSPGNPFWVDGFIKGPRVTPYKRDSVDTLVELSLGKDYL